MIFFEGKAGERLNAINVKRVGLLPDLSLLRLRVLDNLPYAPTGVVAGPTGRTKFSLFKPR
jgi:hypothetical protein